jgi:hypothetical protein
VAALVLVTILSALPARAEEPVLVEPPHAARILPDRTLALFLAEDITLTRESYKETALWKLWEEPEVQTFVAPIIPMIEEIFAKGEEMGGFHFADISAAFGGQVAVAFVGLDTSEMIPLPEIAIIADVTDRAAASRLLERIGRAIEDNSPAKFTVRSVGPLTFGRISQDGDRMETGYVLTESALYICLGPEGKLLESLVMAATKGQPKPLAAEPDFLKAVERAGERRDVFGYVQVRKIIELSAKLAKKFGAPEGEIEKSRLVLDALGLSDVRSVSFVEAVDPPGFRSQIFVHVPSPRSGLFDLIPEDAVEESLIKLAPSKASSLFAFRLRMDKLLPLVRKIIAITEPGATQQIDGMLEMVKQTSGIDIEKGVLKGLGLEGALIVDTVATAGLGPVQGLAGIVLVMRAASPEDFKPVYAVLTAVAQLQALKSGLAVNQTQTPDGATVNAVAIPRVNAMGITPAFTMTSGHLVIGLSVEAVERVCKALSGIAPEPLIEAEDFRSSLSRVGEKPGWLVSFTRPISEGSYTQMRDIAPVVPFLAATVLGQMNMNVPKELSDFLSIISLTDLPMGATIAKHGLAQIGIGWQDSDGIGITNYGPVGLSTPAMAVAGVGAAVAIQRVEKIRSMSRRSQCSSNLEKIGRALGRYVVDDGNYPETLGVLAPGYLKDQSVLSCPESNRGYTYVSGLTQNDRATFIIAFDPTGDHSGGANVLRINGAVSFRRKASFVDRIVGMQVKRLKRQRPNVRLIVADEDAVGEEPDDFF